MEGISTEAASLAGHWGLGKLIVLYDDNKISIDGHTDISFTEDVSARFDALGWHTQHVADGNTDLDAIRKAIETAKSVTDKPSMIKVSTLIGYGSPNKADSHDVHGKEKFFLKVFRFFFSRLQPIKNCSLFKRSVFRHNVLSLKTAQAKVQMFRYSDFRAEIHQALLSQFSLLVEFFTAKLPVKK